VGSKYIRRGGGAKRDRYRRNTDGALQVRCDAMATKSKTNAKKTAAAQKTGCR
jgi:hypothetical protein